MRFDLKFLALLAAPTVVAYIDQPCNGGSNGEGVCIKKSDCVMYGSQTGKVVPYAGSAPNWPCPNDPADVICCIKTVTKLRNGQSLNGRTGRCRNVSKCPSTSELISTYECPGSNNVKLCVPKKATTTTKKTTKKTVTKKTTTSVTVKPTNFKQKEIIDLSQWNTVSNYASAAAAVDGVLLRCGYRGYGSSGSLQKDPVLETHYNGFKGKTKIGYYFFSQAKTAAEAEAEATYVINTLIKGKVNNFPIFWDSELSGAANNSGRADGLSKSARTACAVAFIKKVKSLGYKAGVYASEYWFRDNLDFNQIVNAGATIWIANYSNKPTLFKSNQYQAWQFTDKANIKGIDAPVDKSHVFSNIGGW